MGFTKESAIEAAKRDLAKRLGVNEDDVRVSSVSEQDFPDMSLGAAEKGEMSGQMITSGWSIKLNAGGQAHEYRGDKYQLRLKDFKGANYRVTG